MSLWISPRSGSSSEFFPYVTQLQSGRKGLLRGKMKSKTSSKIIGDGGFRTWFLKCFTTEKKSYCLAISVMYNWTRHTEMNVADPILTN